MSPVLYASLVLFGLTCVAVSMSDTKGQVIYSLTLLTVAAALVLAAGTEFS